MRALLLLLVMASSASADESFNVAVASNFVPTFTKLAMEFRARSGIHARASSGSTGKLYAQVINGAPFAVYMAADSERPRLLEESGFGVAGTRITYATGGLVVWSKQADDCYAALRNPESGRIALADPALAPYGRAAKEFMVAVGAWDPQRVVLGSNAAQAALFAATGNATVAVVSRSLARGPSMGDASCTYDVPGTLHRPIEQQAILLDGKHRGAIAFMAFLQSEAAREIIERAGYEVPQ